MNPTNTEPPITRCYFAEFLGTFVLTFLDAGMGMIAEFFSGDVSLVARSLAPGLTVLAMIFAIGELSGAHINPAVTLAFAVRKVFPWRKVPLYWLMQISGAIFAAVLLRLIFGNIAHLGATLPQQGWESAFATEIILTFILVFVILSTAHQHKISGPQAAVPVGATIATCSLLGKLISGASFNPARSLGPALISGELGHIEIYIAGPMLGALLAVAVVRGVHGTPKEADEKAALGEKNLRTE